MKQKLLISFSGGPTSAFMAQELKKSYGDKFEIIVVFANTGKEDERTLKFVDQCDKFFGLNVVWVEAVVHPGRKGTSHKIVNYETASRRGEPFEEVIKKYGIPNVDFLHCTRELKQRPIHHYAKSIGWKEYITAVGIRADEVDRIKKGPYFYPLVKWKIRREDINKYWSLMPFRLELKSYEGNCNHCFKKSLRKLLTKANDGLHGECRDTWWSDMERKYGHFVPVTQRAARKTPITFFRKHLSWDKIEELSQTHDFRMADDEYINDAQATMEFGTELHPLDLSNGCSESCEAF